MTSNINIAYPFTEDGDFSIITKSAFVDVVYSGPAETLYLRTVTKEAGDYILTWGDELTRIVDTFTHIVEGAVYTVTNNDSTISYVPGTLATVLNDLADGVYDIDLELAVDVTNTTSNNLQITKVGDLLIRGDVQLVEGTNIKLSGDENAITISALSGEGTGKNHGCVSRDPVPYVGTINGVKNNNGSFILKPKGGCYSIEGVPELNKVTFSNKCVACCSCDDYEGLFNYIKNLLTTLSNLKTELDAHVVNLNNAITAYNDQDWSGEVGVEWEYQNGE